MKKISNFQKTKVDHVEAAALVLVDILGTGLYGPTESSCSVDRLFIFVRNGYRQVVLCPSPFGSWNQKRKAQCLLYGK